MFESRQVFLEAKYNLPGEEYLGCIIESFPVYVDYLVRITRDFTFTN